MHQSEEGEQVMADEYVTIAGYSKTVHFADTI
jgi:hypothetical protein